MAEQLTTSAEALRLFFTDDIYLVRTEEISVAVAASPAVSDAAVSTPQPASVPVSAPVIPVAPMPVIAPASEIVFKYLGKNQKNVLILVNDGENDVSSEGGRELLRNLVKAMQLTANDFALLNYFSYSHVQFEELSRFFSSKLVLGFGVSPAQLGLPDQPQHSVGSHGNTQLVFTGRLDLLARDQDGKKKLWSSLKQFIF
ncbi:MAG: hypothetical protein ABWY16_16960 [Pedobacter sp.]|uniref:hypothetical protein n=1 Tax=Pedobacter sp. TaxID=1411316 RepID=UPI0033940228